MEPNPKKIIRSKKNTTGKSNLGKKEAYFLLRVQRKEGPSDQYGFKWMRYNSSKEGMISVKQGRATNRDGSVVKPGEIRKVE